MRRALLLALAVVAALAPAADAHCFKKGCRKMHGARVTVRATASMVAAGVRAAAPEAAPPTDVPPPAADPPPSAPAARLGVVAREWSLVLSRGTLSAGRAVVQLQNFGEDAHNLRIERLDGAGTPLDVPLAESGEVQSGQTTLAAGDYKIYCSLPGHDAQGMHAGLTVTP
jgi:hypothetical protein